MRQLEELWASGGSGERCSYVQGTGIEQGSSRRLIGCGRVRLRFDTVRRHYGRRAVLAFFFAFEINSDLLFPSLPVPSDLHVVFPVESW